MKHLDSLVLIPGKAVGSFQIGAPISLYIDEYNLHLVDAADEIVNWDSYATPDGSLYIYVEDSLIVGISCYDSLIYKNTDLIGLAIEELSGIIGFETQIGDEVGEKTPVEYDELGLQVWLRDEYVSSVTCHEIFE